MTLANGWNSAHRCRQQHEAGRRAPSALDQTNRVSSEPQSLKLVGIEADLDHQTYHNEESGDVVSWLTRSTAASGGKCIISSAYTIYNLLAATRPDVIRTLARSDWPFAL